jgi:hypothetical protein
LSQNLLDPSQNLPDPSQNLLDPSQNLPDAAQMDVSMKCLADVGFAAQCETLESLASSWLGRSGQIRDLSRFCRLIAVVRHKLPLLRRMRSERGSTARLSERPTLFTTKGMQKRKPMHGDEA